VDWEESHAKRFAEAMNDDFNTPIAMSVLFDLASEVNRTGSVAAAHQLKALGGTLGLLERDPHTFLQGGHVAGSLSGEQIEAQIAPVVPPRPRAISPRPTAFAPNCSKPAWCWKTSQVVPPSGGVLERCRAQAEGGCTCPAEAGGGEGCRQGRAKGRRQAPQIGPARGGCSTPAGRNRRRRGAACLLGRGVC
jgi:hypothetical protein